MCGQVGRRWAHPAVRAFHVTSSRNRESIGLVGLDWERMAASPGIAGSLRPERLSVPSVDGVQLLGVAVSGPARVAIAGLHTVA